MALTSTKMQTEVVERKELHRKDMVLVFFLFYSNFITKLKECKKGKVGKIVKLSLKMLRPSLHPK